MRNGVPEHFAHIIVGAFGSAFAKFVEKKPKEDDKKRTPVVVLPTTFPAWYNYANLWYDATNTIMMVHAGYLMSRTASPTSCSFEHTSCAGYLRRKTNGWVRCCGTQPHGDSLAASWSIPVPVRKTEPPVGPIRTQFRCICRHSMALHQRKVGDSPL